MARTRGISKFLRAAQDPALPPTQVIPPPEPGGVIPWDEIFDPARPVEIDVGCGKGRFLLARARKFPQTQFVGIERERARVARIDVVARRDGLTNVRLLMADAMDALNELLPAGRVSAAYFFFPDPWPKRRHRCRRLFSPPFIDALCRVFVPGARLNVSTDQPDYFVQMRQCMEQDSRFSEVEAFHRTPDEKTDFELIFLRQDAVIGDASYRLDPDYRYTPPPPRPKPGWKARTTGDNEK